MERNEDVAQMFVDDLFATEFKNLGSYVRSTAKFNGKSRQEFIDSLINCFKSLDSGDSMFYCRFGHSLWEGKLFPIVELRFTSVLYDASATKFIPLGSKCLREETLFFIGLKVKRNKVVGFFEPVKAFKQEEIQAIAKLN